MDLRDFVALTPTLIMRRNGTAWVIEEEEVIFVSVARSARTENPHNATGGLEANDFLVAAAASIDPLFSHKALERSHLFV